jgi:dTDP-4-amino-4,6-dideoxygalactose transaminase
VTPRTRALLPVSLFGNPLDQGRVDAVAREHGLRVLEDAACALGASFEGRKVGGMADVSVFSLHPRKFVTTGEGGLVTTNDPDLAAWMDSFKHFGLDREASREGAVFSMVGSNLKLSNLQAALGVAQMEMVDELQARRRELAANYLDLLAGAGGVDLPATTPGGEHSWQTFCVLVDGRDEVMARMRAAGVEAQIGTYALHLQPAFRDNPAVRLEGDMAGSRKAFDRALALPLYHAMTTAEQERVVDTLREAVR